MSTQAVEQIANAVLYEGYLLYPYRASALKNRQRWNYGVVYPRTYSEARGGIREARGCMDPWFLETQCLLAARPTATVDVKLRFLRLVERSGVDADSAVNPPWQEAMESGVVLSGNRLADLSNQPARRAFSFNESWSEKDRLVRRQHSIDGTLTVSAEPVDREAYRVAVRVENVTPFRESEASGREAVFGRSFISTHFILHAGDGQFVSLLDPPERFREAAARCGNSGAWPVLAGDPALQDTILCSPIILYDYPEIAPESPGDLFDGTEIDEILTLRILTMTEEEKREMRRTDARAREILERTEGLPPEHFMRLHGVLRAMHPAGEGDT